MQATIDLNYSLSPEALNGMYDEECEIVANAVRHIPTVSVRPRCVVLVKGGNRHGQGLAAWSNS